MRKEVKRTSKLCRIKFSSSLIASKMSATYKPVTLNCSFWRHIINILLTELSRSVWENLDLGHVYRPHCVRSVLSVKILPYRPPARLIRAKYYEQFNLKQIWFKKKNLSFLVT